jgi:hypothetical protein
MTTSRTARLPLIGAVAASALLAASQFEAARADRTGAIVGGIIGGAVIGGILNEMAKGAKAATNPQTSGPRPNRPKSDEAGSGSRSGSGRSAEDRATDARNHAAAEAERNEIRRTEQLERGRDVTMAIQTFRRLLEEHHANLRRQNNAAVKTGSSINQVTEGEIRRSVEAAYKIARLSDFEQFAGELWTKDRLQVRILDMSRRQLGEFFEGVGVKGVSVADLDQIFEGSARRVYTHAMQISEMVGVSHSFDRFIRTIYEHSDRADESLSTIGADSRYERLVAGYVDVVPRETFVSRNDPSAQLANDPTGLERQFLFRFRARRVLYDCMAARYADVVGAGGSRGSAIDAQARPDTSRPAIVRASSKESGGEQVWSRMGAFVEATCRDPLGSLTSEVKENRLQPRPARWDSTGGEATFGGRSPLLPATQAR